MLNRISLVFLSLLSITNILCSQKSDPSQKTSISQIPRQTNDGWQTGSLRRAGIDSTKIMKIVDGIRDSTYQGIHSMLIVKDGLLVFEKYFTGYTFKYEAERFRGDIVNHDLNTIHNLASVTKSVTGLLTGIAFDKGFLHDVKEKIVGFFPKYPFQTDETINQVTLHHLLTMTSGLAWNENDLPYSNVKNDIIQLFVVLDPIKNILSKPVVNEPGTKWYYNGGGTNLLGEIVHATTKSNLEDFAEKNLFSPLGITRYKWVYINPRVVYASGNLELRPRDMAKLGYLVLNDGVWNGNRVVSSRWIKTMIQKHVAFSDTRGFGYQWWLRTYQVGSLSIDACYAAGWGGQYIMVFPSLNAVVVFTGGNYDQKDPVDEIVQRYLLPACIPEDREKSEADARMEYDRIRKEAPIPKDITIVQPGDTTSPDIKTFSGHWYGRWDYAPASQFVVEKIDSDKAVIVYSFLDKGWMRIEAGLTPSGKIEFSIGTATLTFGWNQEEDVLIGNYKEGQSISKIIMRRKRNGW